jgi:nucleoside-diphosphate-sugar epimerase
VARILIVGGGCRGRLLAADLLAGGHAVRITTRSEAGRPAIEALGAQCFLGTPDRLETLRGSLDGVAVACWMLGTATGEEDSLRALHTTRLELFITQAIDTTVRGFVYEPAAASPEGERIARELTARNQIPAVVLAADPADQEAWLAQAGAAVARLLGS